MRNVRPALVVGDFRLSLTTSAPLAKVPLAVLINAYWSPHAARDGFPLPEHPIVRWLGVDTAAIHFPRALPAVFAHFARPVNQLREENGLERIGSLPEVLTYGDFVLFPDVPELAPLRTISETSLYLGHVPWSPKAPMPPLDDFDFERPLIYVTLGSSGRVELLPIVLRALGSLPVGVIASTGGKASIEQFGPNVRIARWIPGDAACAAASIVVCNGGASTAYQALSAGRPVVGIAANLDQYLAMTAIERAGAGILLRSGTLTEVAVRDAVVTLLGSATHRAAAASLAAAFARHDCRARFGTFVERVTACESRSA